MTLKGQGGDLNTVDAYYFENMQQLDIMLHSTERIALLVSRKLKSMRITVKTIFILKIAVMPYPYIIFHVCKITSKPTTMHKLQTSAVIKQQI